MIKFLITYIAYFLIYTAIDYKRKEDSKIETFIKDWWVNILLVTIAGIILIISAKL